MNRKFGRKSAIADALRAQTLGLNQSPSSIGTNADVGNLANPEYVVMAGDATLANERILTAGDALSLTDGGAGGNATLDVGVSGLGLSVDGSNVILTSSSNPGSNARILASTGAGALDLETLNAPLLTANYLYSHANEDWLIIGPTGYLYLNPGGDQVNPYVNYQTNLGSITKKYLTLHAAELWVETLVAQDTLATIGGRVLIGPTTTLIADLGSGDSTMDVKHNQMASGDRVVMESGGKLEWLAISSGPTTITDGYRYSITRNLDGSGANNWYAGDAVFNTGTTGDGFIDLYSLSGVVAGTTEGPTIVGNVRAGAAYNNFGERWAIGNLKGMFGYTATEYGAAFGDYSAGNYLTADDDGLSVFGGGGVAKVDADGFTVIAGSIFDNKKRYKFVDSLDTPVAWWEGYDAISEIRGQLKVDATAKDAVVYVVADTANTGDESQISLYAYRSTTNALIEIKNTSTESTIYMNANRIYTGSGVDLEVTGHIKTATGLLVGDSVSDPSNGELWILDATDVIHVLEPDTDGTTEGMVLRTTTNPSTGGRIFSVQSSGAGDRLIVKHAAAVEAPDGFVTDGGIVVGDASLGVNSEDILYTGNLFSYKNSNILSVYAEKIQLSPITDASYDTGVFSSVSDQQIDMSSVFTGNLTYAQGYHFMIAIRDSGGASTNCWIGFKTSSGGSYVAWKSCHLANDEWARDVIFIPAGANGDIWFDINASGTNTFDLILRVVGYYI
jgi:hypothetical protein